jgi:hypothetical protein
MQRLSRTLVAVMLCAAVDAGAQTAYRRTAAPHVVGTGSSIQGDWKSLFDGKTMSGWRSFEADTVIGWHAEGGEIVKDRRARDLMTKDQYANFELEIEWKIGKAGNSGLFYRGTKEYDHVYWSAPEYQLEDDVNADDNKTPLNRTGAAYAVYPTVDGHVKPFDEWNSTRIVVNGGHVEHWLNGFKVLEYELWSADWKAHVAASKFSAWPNYGLAKKGYIAIQGDHPGTLALRNIRIRELP